MLKLTALVLFTVMSIHGTMNAQTLEKQPPVLEVQTKNTLTKDLSAKTDASTKETKTDLKLLFSKETQKLKNESGKIDAKKLDKAQRQVKRSNWSNKQTLFLVLFAVGVAALVFVAIKYYKKCLRYEDNCSPAFDEICQCEEYEQEEQRASRAMVPNFQSPVPKFGRRTNFKVAN